MSKIDTYTIVTDRIIEALKDGTCPWRKSWSSVGPQNFKSKAEYKGINLFLLGLNGFESPFYLTFKQAKDLGGMVKKGSKGSKVIFWKMLAGEDKNGKEKIFPLLKHYTVFNAEQIDGIDFPTVKDLTSKNEFSPIEKAEKALAGYSDMPEIRHATNYQACYTPSIDKVKMPTKDLFFSSEDYYAVLFHELAHSTGHKSRLARFTSAGSFGSDPYAKEELIAELTSAFICAVCGIDNSLKENQESYIASWLKVLKGDSKFIIQAASGARKAADRIQGITYAKEEKKAA